MSVEATAEYVEYERWWIVGDRSKTTLKRFDIWYSCRDGDSSGCGDADNIDNDSGTNRKFHLRQPPLLLRVTIMN